MINFDNLKSELLEPLEESLDITSDSKKTLCQSG